MRSSTARSKKDVKDEETPLKKKKKAKKKDAGGVDAKELEICRQRGHDIPFLGASWSKCKWCHMWVREVRTVEERADPPDAKEQNPLQQLQSIKRG